MHFDDGLSRNGFAWVTCCWEISLVDQIGHLEVLTEWLSEIQKRWPNARCVTQGEFGLLWRQQFRDNEGLDYTFSQCGTGTGGSDKDKEITWFMNKDFRLALLRHTDTEEPAQVIDFTRYDVPAEEPTDMTRRWSLMGKINQKQTRPQDELVLLSELPEEDRNLIS